MSKNKKIIIGIVNILIIVIFIWLFVIVARLQDGITIQLDLGESHTEQPNTAQLFYSDDTENWKKNVEITVSFEDNKIIYPVSKIDFSKNYIRLDPVSRKEKFSIKCMNLSYGSHKVFSLTGKELYDQVDTAESIKASVKGDILVCKSKGTNPRLCMNWDFSKKIDYYNKLLGEFPYIVLAVLYIFWGILESLLLRKEQEVGRRWLLIIRICSTVVLALGVLVIYVLQYFKMHFGDVPLGQLIYHLHTPLDGTDVSSYTGAIWLGVGMVVGVSAIFQIVCIVLSKKNFQYGIVIWGGVLGILLLGYTGIRAIYQFDIPEYYKYTHSSTNLYEAEYVDGRDIKLTFPEQKRNLIYIFLESMEITYADTTSGGGMSENYIPELTQLAQENECFSDGSELNGAYQIPGATFTMGALTAQTSGTPINETLVSNDTLNGIWDSENNYLPGVWSIGDILKQQGYNQEFLIGSDGAFAGRASYFRGHGNYDVEDYKEALQKQRIPKDYKVWWGYEDEKLFAFAKEDLTELANKKEPFNFTMLTVDTHFTGGYMCERCEVQYPDQFSNVIACSSKQVGEFVDWIKQQDFYENTTIVIAGDHLTPDSYYISNSGVTGFDRRTYVVIINPASGRVANGEKRLYTTLDLYPTTLSSLGVDIEGGRLGLGVDLYSGEPTLVEKYGMEYLNTELLKNSNFYTKKLLYNK